MRHLPTLAFLAALPFTVAAQTPAPLRFELPNGLRVWVQEDHTRPIALVQVAYKVGAINETPGTTGTAHYVEHMVYRATEHIKNEDVYGYIDRIGGRYTGGTSRDGTTYGETVPRWALESALRVTAERMGRTLFDSVEFERERNNVVTEANGFSRNDPVTALRDAEMLTSFELHPYRYSSNTWSQDNLQITRDDAYEFYKHFYGPNNAVLTIVGDVQPDEVRRLVTRHFASLSRAPRSGAVAVVEPPQRAEKRVVLSAPGVTPQVDVVYRSPAATGHDYPVLAVLDRALSRRLQSSLTNLGATNVTSTHTPTPYPFVYRINVTAPPGTGVSELERVVSVIQMEIERLGRDTLFADELTNARVQVVTQGRGGRGGGGGGGGAGTPPRQSNLTQIAGQLTARESFAWEVSNDQRDEARRAESRVSAADIVRYVDRWLRASQRTVGMLVQGPDDFMPAWSNNRPLAGNRLEIPPLTTMPAKRTRPEPVPAKSLEPLAPLPLELSRRLLGNNVVVRVAHTSAGAPAVQARVSFGTLDSGEVRLAQLAARLIGGDSSLQALGVRVATNSLPNDGSFDLRIDGGRATLSVALGAIGHALAPRAFTSADVEAAAVQPSPGGGGRGGRGGAGVAADARDRVLRVVAPAWRLDDGTRDIAAIDAAGVNDFIANRLTGGAVTVSVTGADATADVLAAATRALAGIRSGPRTMVTHATARATVSLPAEERIAAASETQVTLLAGLPGVARDNPDRRALELLNYIVGVPSYGGRLGWALTKAGLTYSASATTTVGASTGHITFSTKCDTRNVDATIQAIREVIAGIADRGVEAWEVREAQAFTLGRTLLYGVRDDSGVDAIATALLDSESSGDELLDLPALSRAYLAVTPEQINAAARKYYRSELLKVVAIGAIPKDARPSVFPPGTFRRLFEP